MTDRRGMLALSGTGMLWGTLGLTVRLLQDTGIPTIVIGFWRLVLATSVLLVVVGRPALASMRTEFRHKPVSLIVVGVAFAVFQLGYFVGVRTAGLAVATLVCLGVAPVAAVAIEVVRERRPPSARTAVTVTAAVLGLTLICLASGVDPVTAPRPLFGITCSLVAGLAYAGSAVVSGPLSRRLGSFTITTATSAVALLTMTPFALATGIVVPLTTRTVVGLLWLGLVTTVLAYGLFYYGLRTTPGSVAMVLTLLEPATAVVLAVLVLGEPVTPAGATGTLLLVGAVVVLYLAPSTPRATATTAPPPAP